METLIAFFRNLGSLAIIDGTLVSQRQFVSGDITAAEAALARQQGLKPAWRIGDTENRALRAIELQAGDRLVMQGQYAPCPTCQNAMTQRAASTGAEIQYRYLDNAGRVRVWSAQQGGYIFAEF
jgi:hypothetical protein